MALGKIKLSDGAEILMEYNQEEEQEQSSGRVKVGVAKKAASALDFGEVVQTITSLAKDLKTVVKQTESKKVSVEFGIQISLGTGGVTNYFVKSDGSANLKIKIEWQTSNEVSTTGDASRKDLNHIPNE